MDNIVQFTRDDIIEKSICRKYEYLELMNAFKNDMDSYSGQLHIMDFRYIATQQDHFEINFPNELEIIFFDYRFNGIINFTMLNLPPNLKMVNFPAFEINDYDYLPSDLRILSIDGNYNKPLINLPPNLEVLICGSSYNHSIDELPDSLVCLILGYQFNHPIRKLPSNLKYLKFGPNYNQILPPVLFPKTIKKIYIPYFSEGSAGAKPCMIFLDRKKIFANYGNLFNKSKIAYY